MKTFRKFLDYKIKTLAFMDCVEDGLEMMLPYWDAEIAGFSTVHVPQNLRSVSQIVTFIQKHAQAAVCVNRLGRHNSPLFCGARLVAALYDVGIPALLVTQYLDIDQHSSIRLWREKLPVVLHLREFQFETLEGHLEFCMAELQGHVAPSRVPYRVMVGVVHVEKGGRGNYVDVSIDYWDHYQRVRLPIGLIPHKLHSQVVPGAWFFAQVNVHAEHAHELYFRDFALAPIPEYDENLTYCVNVLDDSTMSDLPMLWFENQRDQEQIFDSKQFGADKNMLN